MLVYNAQRELLDKSHLFEDTHHQINSHTYQILCMIALFDPLDTFMQPTNLFTLIYSSHVPPLD